MPSVAVDGDVVAVVVVAEPGTDPSKVPEPKRKLTNRWEPLESCIVDWHHQQRVVLAG